MLTHRSSSIGRNLIHGVISVETLRSIRRVHIPVVVDGKAQNVPKMSGFRRSRGGIKQI